MNQDETRCANGHVANMPMDVSSVAIGDDNSFLDPEIQRLEQEGCAALRAARNFSDAHSLGSMPVPSFDDETYSVFSEVRRMENLEQQLQAEMLTAEKLFERHQSGGKVTIRNNQQRMIHHDSGRIPLNSPLSRRVPRTQASATSPNSTFDGGYMHQQSHLSETTSIKPVTSPSRFTFSSPAKSTSPVSRLFSAFLSPQHQTEKSFVVELTPLNEVVQGTPSPNDKGL